MAGQKHDANCRTMTIPACLTYIACKHLSAPKAHSIRAKLTKCIKMPKDQSVTSAKANSKLYKSSKLTLTSLFCQLTREGPQST